MRVRSKLADVEFKVGVARRQGNQLVVTSHAAQRMQSAVYIAPRDVFSMLWAVLKSPSAVGFVILLPLLYWRDRRAQPRSSRR